MAVKNPKRLDPTVTYRIDGLPEGLPAEGWRITSTIKGVMWFVAPDPAHERVAVDLERLFQVRSGHLHYVAD